MLNKMKCHIELNIEYYIEKKSIISVNHYHNPYINS